MTEDPDAINEPGIGQYGWIILILIIVVVFGELAYLLKKKQPPEEPETVQIPEEPAEKTD